MRSPATVLSRVGSLATVPVINPETGPEARIREIVPTPEVDARNRRGQVPVKETAALEMENRAGTADRARVPRRGRSLVDKDLGRLALHARSLRVLTPVEIRRRVRTPANGLRHIIGRRHIARHSGAGRRKTVLRTTSAPITATISAAIISTGSDSSIAPGGRSSR